jgi:hypothetical protein
MSKVILVAAILGGGCVKNGMGEGVRTDVTARMESKQATIADCYQAALKRDRKIRGQMVLTFRAAPSTGKFEGVEIVRDDLHDTALGECVKDAVATLALEAPQKTAVSITYPLDFAPTK